VGNIDRIGPNGTTDRSAFDLWTWQGRQARKSLDVYFLQLFPRRPRRGLQAHEEKFPEKAKRIWHEIYVVVGIHLVCLIYDLRAVLMLVPFYYLDHPLSSLNGYYKHFKGNPDAPIAWGVSTFNKVYNWAWLYNGHHAEHHFYPKEHWTKMVELRDSIVADQRTSGVYVMPFCHGLGFLDRQPPQYTVVALAGSARPA
jgi:fatty acid desaturase